MSGALIGNKRFQLKTIFAFDKAPLRRSLTFPGKNTKNTLIQQERVWIGATKK